MEDNKNSKETMNQDLDTDKDETTNTPDMAETVEDAKEENKDINSGAETDTKENSETIDKDNEEANDDSDEDTTAEEGKKGKSFFKKDKKDEKDKKDQMIEELNDRLIRTMAEFDNYRKRTEKEKAQMFEIGARDIIEKILPVIDNFERGLGTLTEEEKESAFVQGIEKIYKQLVTSLTEAGLKPIEAVGKPFDPNFHNAVMHEEDPEQGENIVAEEFLKGYMYKDTVVRHSMVKVVN